MSINESCDEDQISATDTFLIENVSTECCSSAFASSTSSSTVTVDDGISSDDDTVDIDKNVVTTFFGNKKVSRDESLDIGDRYLMNKPSRSCCSCKFKDFEEFSRKILHNVFLHFAGKHIHLFFGAISLMLGMITVHFDLYEFVLNERMRMTPGLPPFQLWLAPKPVITMRIFIFTAENPDAFLSGADEQLHLKEIGPIVYQEHLMHEDVQIHDENSTLSYTPHRWLEYLPDRNIDGILNQTITVPNFVLLVSTQCY